MLAPLIINLLSGCLLLLVLGWVWDQLRNPPAPTLPHSPRGRGSRPRSAARDEEPLKALIDHALAEEREALAWESRAKQRGPRNPWPPARIDPIFSQRW
jgi:hypothetical protein